MQNSCHNIFPSLNYFWNKHGLDVYKKVIIPELFLHPHLISLSCKHLLPCSKCRDTFRESGVFDKIWKDYLNELSFLVPAISLSFLNFTLIKLVALFLKPLLIFISCQVKVYKITSSLTCSGVTSPLWYVFLTYTKVSCIFLFEWSLGETNIGEF